MNNIYNIALINYNLFDENKNWIGARTNNGDIAFGGEKKHSFHINLENSKFIRFTFRRYSSAEDKISLNDVKNSDIQFERNRTETDFIPHQEQNYPISLGNIEMLEIGTHRDKIDGSPNNWYIPNKVQKIVSYNGETIKTDYISTTGGLDIGATVYYVGNEDYHITDKTLIKQLNKIFERAKSYQGTTHITAIATGTNLPIQLKTKYKKSNLLRIQALEQAILSQGANV